MPVSRYFKLADSADVLYTVSRSDWTMGGPRAQPKLVSQTKVIAIHQ